MDVRQVIAAVDRLAPFELAEPWDHVRLQVAAAGDDLPAGGAAGGPGAAQVVLVALEVDDDEPEPLGVAAADPLADAPGPATR